MTGGHERLEAPPASASLDRRKRTLRTRAATTHTVRSSERVARDAPERRVDTTAVRAFTPTGKVPDQLDGDEVTTQAWWVAPLAWRAVTP